MDAFHDEQREIRDWFESSTGSMVLGGIAVILALGLAYYVLADLLS